MTWPICLCVCVSVANSSRHRWRLGFDGKIHGAGNLQVPESRTRGPLLPAGNDFPLLNVARFLHIMSLKLCFSRTLIKNTLPRLELMPCYLVGSFSWILTSGVVLGRWYRLCLMVVFMCFTDWTAFKYTGESRIHSRDNVWIVQRTWTLHSSSGASRLFVVWCCGHRYFAYVCCIRHYLCWLFI